MKAGPAPITVSVRRDGRGLAVGQSKRIMFMTWAEWDELQAQVAELRTLPKPEKRHRVVTVASAQQ